MVTRKIGRDAGTGQFKPVREAQKDREGSVVETVKYTSKTPQTAKSTPPKRGQ